MMIRLAMLVSLAGVLACAGSAAPRADTAARVGISSGAGSMGGAELHDDPVSATRTVAAPADSVWLALARVYEALGIADAGAAPGGQRAYGARGFRPRRIEGKRLSTYIDCGMGPTATPKADEYGITMDLISTLAAATDSAAVVETMLAATGKPRSTAGQRVSCQSNGTLESRVGELLVELLFAGR